MRKRSWVVVAIAAALSACAEIRVHRGGDLRATMGEREVQTFKEVGFGLKALSAPLNLSEKCPGGWQEWNTRKSALQSALSVVTLGIYTPWTVELACRPAPR